MPLHVEAEDAAPEQSLQDLLPEGADSEPLGVRPGDVPEGKDGGAREALADEPRRESEMVVLHEDDRVVAVDLLADGLGEAAVHFLVVLEVLAPEARPGVRDVAQ